MNSEYAIVSSHPYHFSCLLLARAPKYLPQIGFKVLHAFADSNNSAKSIGLLAVFRTLTLSFN